MTDLSKLRAGGAEIQLEHSNRAPEPDSGAKGMANLLFVARGKKVLDLAGGTGFFGIVAAKVGAEEVWMGDPNPETVDLARRNAELNGVEMTCKAGPGFEPFGGRTFDLIIADPAQLPAPPGITGPAFGGRDGLARLEMVIQDAPDHLERGGELLTRLTSLVEADLFESMLNKRFRFRNFPKVRREFTPDEFNAIHPALFNHLRKLRNEKKVSFEEENGKYHYGICYYMAMIK